ncbi:MAG TPA: hypothetical protein PKY96_16105, partial [Flavobacteriales bacterium]|nr:hypothetical protein [Flavobacteriales bacterium]
MHALLILAALHLAHDASSQAVAWTRNLPNGDINSQRLGLAMLTDGRVMCQSKLTSGVNWLSAIDWSGNHVGSMVFQNGDVLEQVQDGFMLAGNYTAEFPLGGQVLSNSSGWSRCFLGRFNHLGQLQWAAYTDNPTGTGTIVRAMSTSPAGKTALMLQVGTNATWMGNPMPATGNGLNLVVLDEEGDLIWQE